MDKAKVKKIGNIVLNVLLYIFLIICILSVIVTVISKRDSDGAAEIFGYQMRIVTSDSMAKCEYTDVSDFDIKDIPIRSMVFVKMVPDDPDEATEFYRSLDEGDVLTFRYVYTTQVTITHRITSIIEKETGGFIIELAGDNKSSEDGQMVQTIDTSVLNSPNYVIGKVVGQAYLFGAIMSFLMQPIGIILLIIAPCFIIISIEVVKIIRTLNADKKKREQDEREQKDNELEELRRRLAELEKEKNETPPAQTTENTENEETKEDKTE